jgi:hypothetical protein
MSWVNVIARDSEGNVVGVHVMPANELHSPLPEHVAEWACPCHPAIIRDDLFSPPIISHRAPFHPGSNTLPDA